MDEIKIALMGDIQINRTDSGSAFSKVQHLLNDADIRLCQLEATMSEKGEVRPDVQNPSHRVPPKMINALTSARIDAVTFAGNNNLDYGPGAMFETVKLLNDNHIQVVGVGKNLTEAREPIYIEIRGMKVAIVNACSVLRSGFEATDDRPGLSPLHISTFYETIENVYEQPGTPARTITVPDFHDLKAICDIISEAKKKSDYVLACFHWGVHFTYDLALYQPDVAYAAIDAGADAVIGTHPHNLQAIDIYKGVPIFYSLGNFIFDQPEEYAPRTVSKYLKVYGMSPKSGAKNYPHPKHTRDTALTYLTLTKNQIDFRIIPVRIDENATPTPVEMNSNEGKKIFNLLKNLSQDIGTELVALENGITTKNKEKKIDTRLQLRKRMLSYPWLYKLQIAEYSDFPILIEDMLT